MDLVIVLRGKLVTEVTAVQFGSLIVVKLNMCVSPEVVVVVGIAIAIMGGLMTQTPVEMAEIQGLLVWMANMVDAAIAQADLIRRQVNLILEEKEGERKLGGWEVRILHVQN
jgi:hypothetical protein